VFVAIGAALVLIVKIAIIFLIRNQLRGRVND